MIWQISQKFQLSLIRNLLTASCSPSVNLTSAEGKVVQPKFSPILSLEGTDICGQVSHCKEAQRLCSVQGTNQGRADKIPRNADCYPVILLS